MPAQSPTTPGGPDAGREPPRTSRKRPAVASPGARYPRKRSSKACHVCRARKTKCDNVRPACGFCTSLGIACSYDDAAKDHSVFDPASIEILSQLQQIIDSQHDLARAVRALPGSHQTFDAAPDALPPTQAHARGLDDAVGFGASGNAAGFDAAWLAQQPDSASTTPTASASVAAVRWFDLLATDASRDGHEDANVPVGLEGGFLDLFSGQDKDDLTPLQRATQMIDGQPPTHPENDSKWERGMWQSPGDIPLLDREQVLFKNFLSRICSWLDLFNLAGTVSTTVPHLAVRNAGLLNAILALSCYHMSVDGSAPAGDHADQNTALQYYYQTLHYVQKAMRYPTYQNSRELMVTTLVISTYEMLRGSRTDWQRHLQGVLWILRSRQIEVEESSLESATWWAWLCQDIWVAFRQGRRTYSTWTPKKGYAELNPHELATRGVWIFAQVINFCAINPSEDTDTSIVGRLGWGQALRKMLEEWESHLTVEFSQLPATSSHESAVFKPRLIHPSCFGLAVQVHHVSRILLEAHAPCIGGLESFMSRQAAIRDSIDVVCGIGMTLTDDAPTILSSQCLFIAGLFIQEPRQRSFVVHLLDQCRARCGWPTTSLGNELQDIWDSPESTRGLGVAV